MSRKKPERPNLPRQSAKQPFSRPEIDPDQTGDYLPENKGSEKKRNKQQIDVFSDDPPDPDNDPVRGQSVRDEDLRRDKYKQRAVQSMSVATVLMMTGLLLSKLTGQLREILIVPVLGYGIISDAFIIGFQVPDLFYQLLVGGAIQAAITPALAAAVARKNERQGWRSVSILINVAGLIMLAAVVLGILTAPFLISFYNRGKEQEIIDLAIRVSQALFPQTFFMMLAALCIGILNAYKRFTATAFGPSIYNICVVMAMLLLGQASPLGAVRVASGVLLAAAVYFLLQFYQARHEFRFYVFSFDIHDPGFKSLLFLAIPTLLSGSIVQVNTIILTSFARQFPGAVTSLRQASTTWQLPYGVFVVAIGSVMLPSLAGAYASRDKNTCRRLLTSSLRNALFIMMPSAGIFLALRYDMIRGIFQWSSHYTNEAAAITASVLTWYCLAMVAQTFVFIINQAFYARRMTRIALYNGLLTLVLNTVFCVVLTRMTTLGVASLSLAYTLTSFISAGLLYYLYRWLDPSAAPRRLWPFMIRSFICLIVMLLVMIGMNAVPFDPMHKVWQLFWLAARSMVAFIVYLAVAIKLKMKEPVNVIAKIKTRFHLA